MPLTFADELAAFRARTADPGYRALILLGTRQATTAALLIGTLPVARVGFLLTNATHTLPDQVAALLGRSADGWVCPDGDHSTTLRVYAGLRQLIELWGDLDRAMIAVDVTGGLKPMSVGVEKAAHLLGLTTIYVQSEYEKLPDGRAVPKPGTQWLEIPPDPYLVFGDLEAAEATRQYRQHDYAIAAQAFSTLAARVPLPVGARYAALAALAAMYAAWDVLDFTQALVQANALLALPLSDLSDLAPHAARLAEQRAMLGRLVDVATSVVRRDEAARQTLADADAMLPLLGTLHAAALRRAAQGRYDFAALFRYRCLELISQHRLASYGILCNRPDYRTAGVASATLRERFVAVQQTVGRKDLKKLPERNIALFDGYMLLAALDDPLVRGYTIKQIEERSQARNLSVLAHGYQLIGPTEYNEFATVVDEIVNRLFTAVLERPRADWEDATRFVELLAT
jgi:CRISPR-associated protein (TIGR02710 family)